MIDRLCAYGGGRYVEMAVIWSRLAQLGNMDLRTALAKLHISALPSITFFPAKAASLCRQAVEQCGLIAQMNLNNLHTKGVGISTDLTKVAFWLERAAYKGFDWVMERLRQLELKLTKVDRAEVVRLTTEWRLLHQR